jgi:DNA-binding Lrp family transcriptional regulator
MVEPKEKSKPKLREPKAKKFGLKITPIRSPHEDFIKPLSTPPITEDDTANRAAPANDAAPARNAATAKNVPPPRQNAAAANRAAPANDAAQTARPQPDLLASLPEVKGYIRLYHQIIDHLLPQLDPLESYVYLHLYRLSWGFGNSSCVITNPGLARRCNLSERTIRNITPKLREKGLIEKIRIMESGEGVEWKVIIPAGAAQDAGAARNAGAARFADSNRKDLIDTINREKASPDYKNCPDCNGSGFWYPEGVEKGVAKCRHERLKEGK